MSCKKPTFNICMLKQERFKSPTFNMGDLDLNGKTFVYKVKPKKSMGYKDYPTSIVENLVIINEFDLPVGKYQHEFGFTDDNGYFVLFQGELEITNVSKNKCTPCNANIVIKDCNEVINMSYSESVIEINEAGGGGSSDLMVSITHSDLLDLVNSNSLVAGQQYRITDYVATVDTDVYNNARSNNHAFDIIVVADSESVLNENARAIKHEADAYFLSNTKFEAWQLKYTIFNDADRFDWALSSGKGVIYQLIDEWNNDLPYDFKSIQFQRDDIWAYTFGGGSDASLSGMIFNNKIIYSVNQENPLIKSLPNNIVNSQVSMGNDFGLMCASNTLGEMCTLNTFGLFCTSNTFGNDCQNNTFRNNCQNNTFGNYCLRNTFGNNCTSNTLGNNCESSTFGNNCSNLIIEDNPSCRFNVGDGVSNINLSAQLSNFTTPPDFNTVEVYRTVNGVAFRQEVSAGVFETFDVV